MIDSPYSGWMAALCVPATWWKPGNERIIRAVLDHSRKSGDLEEGG
jgi:hypothetical protein